MLLALVACSDSSETPASPAPDAGVTQEAGADAATTPDAAVDANAPADANTPTPVQPDGRYVWGTWTCGAKDIKAFAMSLGITSVETTISGATGSVAVGYPASCVRTTAITSVTYPAPGTISTSTAASFTCSASCAPATCTPGPQAVINDTFSFSESGGTVTYTRVLDAAQLANPSLQKAAGCQAGETETATHIRQ